MSIIKELIESQAHAKIANARLASAKMRAAQYIKESGYDVVEAEGYKIKIKEGKRQKHKTSQELVLLIDLIENVQSELADSSASEIYQLQREIREKELRLHNIINNEEVALLKRLLNSLQEELADAEESKIDVVCRLDSRSDVVLKYVSERKLREMELQAKPRRKAFVIEFILNVAQSGNLDQLDSLWQNYYNNT